MTMKQRPLWLMFAVVFVSACNQFYKDGLGIRDGWFQYYCRFSVEKEISNSQRAQAHNRTSPAGTGATRIVHGHDQDNTIGEEEEEEADEKDSYTVVVVRCKKNITWLQEVPSDWRIVVYDKCKRNTAKELPTLTNLIRHAPAAVGPEECNGYLDYMHDYYHDLTTVTVFMHDDGLRPYDTTHRKDDTHTPFDTFDPIVQISKQFLTKEQPFIHMGLNEQFENWGTQDYHGQAMRILWPYFAIPTSSSQQHNNNNNNSIVQADHVLDKPPYRVTFKPSAHFMVRKEQIQKRPQSTYYALLQQMRFAEVIQGYQDSRRLCCAMERLWHVFFGQPPILPKRAIASDLLNLTECFLCNIFKDINDKMEYKGR